MKPILVLAALLCAVVPTFAQSTKVYTNADVGHPLSPNRGTVSAEQLVVSRFA